MKRGMKASIQVNSADDCLGRSCVLVTVVKGVLRDHMNFGVHVGDNEYLAHVDCIESKFDAGRDARVELTVSAEDPSAVALMILPFAEARRGWEPAPELQARQWFTSGQIFESLPYQGFLTSEFSFAVGPFLLRAHLEPALARDADVDFVHYMSKSWPTLPPWSPPSPVVRLEMPAMADSEEDVARGEPPRLVVFPIPRVHVSAVQQSIGEQLQSLTAWAAEREQTTAGATFTVLFDDRTCSWEQRVGQLPTAAPSTRPRRVERS